MRAKGRERGRGGGKVWVCGERERGVLQVGGTRSLSSEYLERFHPSQPVANIASR